MNDICFVAQGTKQYQKFLIPFALFVLFHHQGACVEMIVDTPKLFNNQHAEELQLLRNIFGQQCVYVSKNQHCNPKFHAGVSRFLHIPVNKRKYTYIGDVDIIILENILPFHLNMLEKYKLPYSNIVRRSTRRLTGLHFVETKKYYTEQFKKVAKETTKQKRGKGDERILYGICQRLHGIISTSDPAERPDHGIHMSPNRGMTCKMKLTIPHDRFQYMNTLIENEIVFANMMKISSDTRKLVDDVRKQYALLNTKIITMCTCGESNPDI